MKKLKTNTQTKQRLVTLLILVLIMVILSCISNKYLMVNNLINIVHQESTLLFLRSSASPASASRWRHCCRFLLASLQARSAVCWSCLPMFRP